MQNQVNARDGALISLYFALRIDLMAWRYADAHYRSSLVSIGSAEHHSDNSAVI
jgi:hypothetical protein